jgi:amino acid adenylation domain-containing protein/non-ribosomal peptide synthase protein (TIGR01720 family)
MMNLDERIAALSPQQRALLELRLKNQAAETSKLQIIPRRREDNTAPLSFAQQRMWLLYQFDPESSVYNIASNLRLRGPLDVAVLEQSLNEVIRRHEALRTTFTEIDGQPAQVIASEMTLTLRRHDFAELPQAEREAKLRRFVSEGMSEPFNLSHGPLLRATLIRLGAEEHVLQLLMHHIVSDAWSLDVLLKEMIGLYEAFLKGEPSPFPPLPIQYADFACWQRERLDGEAMEIQVAYWKNRLSDTPPILELPTDRPRPAIQTMRGARQSFTLSAALTEQLKAISRKEGATLYMTLLASWQALLARYSGQQDILVGTSIANRNRSETEPLIGFFLNMLVLRTDLSGDPSFRELLARVRQVTLDAFAHQDVPFEKLVEELQLERVTSHPPIFQVAFGFGDTTKQSPRLSKLSYNPLELDATPAKFDLTLDIGLVEQGMIGALVYNADLFDAGTASRMLQNLTTLLEAVVAAPDVPLSRISLVNGAERERMLVEWNDTQLDYPQDVCIHEVFEAQAESSPQSIAVVFEGEEVSYEDLNRRANQLAHHLRSLGVRAEMPVGLYVERSVEMIVGLLAILKAGGVYVPLDPAYPSERLSWMMEDAGVSFIITQQQLLFTLPTYAATAEVVCIDSEWEIIEQQSVENPARACSSENLAYVIYTSGSTGRPKGIGISHRAAASHLAGAQKAFEMRADDRVLQFASLNFDVSLEQIFTTLWTGARLVVRGAEVWSAEEFFARSADYGLTVANFPTAYWQQLTQTLDPTELARNTQLRLVIVGGDAIMPEAVAQWQSAEIDPGAIRLLNAYGPTEATITASAYDIPANFSEASSQRRVPIGRPLPNKSIYLLDENLEPVPVGVPGALFIGGDGLARGYLHRPDLTASRFIPHPFSSSPNQRLYDSGDLARFLPDGSIEFLGRLDQQVKIRGFRIELGEVEAVLNEQEGIKEAVVVVRQAANGEKRLVAYVVAATGTTAEASQWRAYMKERVPEYMIPSVFVEIAEMPLTVSGKIDRQALPEAESEGRAEGAGYEEPRTAIEESLAGIWKQVLGVERVGIHDNFFELGGDSILSIQIVARANQAGLRLTAKQIFEHQTVAELAAVAGTGAAAESEQGQVTGPVPLTPIQKWFFEESIALPQHWNQAVLLETRQPLDTELLEKVVKGLLEHHDALRLRFMVTPEGVEQVNSFVEANTPVELIDLSSKPDAEQRACIEEAANRVQASLSFAEGSLVRVAYFDLGEGKAGRLLIVIHHLLVDGVSWRILLEDLQRGYEQLSQGEEMRLPAKTTSYKRWAERLQEYAQSDELQQEAAFWLEDARREVCPQPLDYPSGANTVESSKAVNVSLSADETRLLLQEMPKVFRTEINDVLLTALWQAFTQWTGETELLFDLEGHGREEIFEDVDLSRTVGWFTSIYPVRLQPRDSGDAQGELLKHVQQQLRRINNHGIGYGLLRYLCEDLSIAFALEAAPKAEVSFNYLGQFDQVLEEDSLFAPARESAGASRSASGLRPYLLEINASISGGVLQVSWTYSENVHRRATIEKLAGAFTGALRSLIELCETPDAVSFAPSDFPLLKFDQRQLDKLIAEINKTTDTSSIGEP